MDEPRLSRTTGDLLERNFYARVPEKRRPAHLRSAEWEAKERERTRRGEPSVDEELDDDVEAEEKMKGTGEKVDTLEQGLPLPVTATTSKPASDTHSSPSSTLAPNVRHYDPSQTIKTDPLGKGQTASAAAKREAKFKKKFPGNEEGGKVWDEEDGRAYDQSLVWALSKTFLLVWPSEMRSDPTKDPNTSHLFVLIVVVLVLQLAILVIGSFPRSLCPPSDTITLGHQATPSIHYQRLCRRTIRRCTRSTWNRKGYRIGLWSVHNAAGCQSVQQPVHVSGAR